MRGYLARMGLLTQEMLATRWMQGALAAGTVLSETGMAWADPGQAAQAFDSWLVSLFNAIQLPVLTILALVAIWAGIQIATSHNNPQRRSDAWGLLLGVAVGGLVVFGAKWLATQLQTAAPK